MHSKLAEHKHVTQLVGASEKLHPSGSQPYASAHIVHSHVEQNVSGSVKTEQPPMAQSVASSHEVEG